MSPSSNIRPRQSATRGTRYQVRYRAGGRDTGWVVVATFATLREARICKQWVDGELAAGRRPDLRARLSSEPVTVAALAAEYGANIDGASARKRHRHTVLRLGALARRPAASVSGREVQEWINAQRAGAPDQRPLSPASTRQYLGELSRIFSWGEVTPNPCDWPHLMVPRDETDAGEERGDPPSLREFEAILAEIGGAHFRRASRRYLDVLVVIEGTGMRISELARLQYADVDRRGGRIRIAGSKTTAARRFVPLLPRVLEAIDRQAMAPEDRVGRVFGDITDQGTRRAMARACKWAGLRHFHPHDLRERWITLCSLAGVPLPLIREMAGHTKNTMTLDVYTGVILDEPAWRLDELRAAVGRMTGLAAGPRGVPVGSDGSAESPNMPISRANVPSGGYRDRTLGGSPDRPSERGMPRTDGGPGAAD